MKAAFLAIAGAALLLAALPRVAAAQQIDLSHGGPIAITAVNGIEWRQADHEVIASGDAKAVRGDVTVTADRLIAWYRKKGGAAGQPAATPVQAGMAADADNDGNEVYRLRAEGNVHIYTPTDQAWGDLATYDIDQAVLVMTGRSLRLTTPTDVLTARDDVEYWSAKHMAVARGDAVVVTKDGRRLAADTLVAYTSAAPATASAGPPATQVAVKSVANADPLVSSGKLEKVEAFGHVSVRTVTDTVTGERAVYVPGTGMARVLGKVRITRGQNQLAGAEAVVDLKTGVSHLLAGNTGRVQGLLVPNDETNKSLVAPSPPAAPKPGARP
ncbi:MAG TPA: LptA/OstA family protein [Acetobacteraceae bacterium]